MESYKEYCHNINNIKSQGQKAKKFISTIYTEHVELLAFTFASEKLDSKVCLDYSANLNHLETMVHIKVRNYTRVTLFSSNIYCHCSGPVVLQSHLQQRLH